MKNLFTRLSIIIATATFFAVGIALPTYATDSNDICKNTEVAQAVKDAAGCTNNGDLRNVIINIINVVLGIVSVIAVVAIIIGGVQYMTSTGDPGKVKKARDTILYSVIGLVICALAATIVNFVIRASTTKTASSYSTQKDCQSAGYKWDTKTKQCN